LECDTLNARECEPANRACDATAGPEIVSVDEPAAGTFKVGVHYYEDSSFGVSYASVVIMLDGLLAYELRDKALPSRRTWWEVCAVSWPSRNVVPIDRITATVPVCL
jgi:hypothetical protein